VGVLEVAHLKSRLSVFNAFSFEREGQMESTNDDVEKYT
jgi:hypothetical protein